MNTTMWKLRTMLAGCILALCANATGGELPKTLFDEAVKAETEGGNLEKAAGLYRLIGEDAKASREFFAQAQYRLGLCYLKQGKTREAEEAIGVLGCMYPEQVDLARDANAQLAKMAAGGRVENTPNSWVYFPSTEAGQGPVLALKLGGGEKRIPVTRDTLLISYLADGAYSAHQQLSVNLNDQNRVLLAFDLPSDVDMQALKHAELQLEMRQSGVPVVEPFQLAAYAIAGEWGDDTSWKTQPAADPQPVATVEVSPSPGPVRVDVTEVVRAWAGGQRPNHGLMLKVRDAIYGPPPRSTATKTMTTLTNSPPIFSTAEAREMGIGEIFAFMVNARIGYDVNAGLWALIARAGLDGDSRRTVIDEATRRLRNTGGWGYERWCCCQVLAGIGDAESIPVLADVLERDGETGIRSAAASALGAFDDPKAVEALKAVQQDEMDAGVKSVIGQALDGAFRLDRAAQVYVAENGRSFL